MSLTIYEPQWPRHHESLKLRFFLKSRQVYDVLNNESDLACVLIATSYLDNALATLLKRHLIESSVVNRVLESPRGPLSSFASRSDLAYCLGLISKGLRKNLEIIGQIRNTF